MVEGMVFGGGWDRQLAASAAEATLIVKAVCGPLRDGLAAAGFDPR